jgi:hypothetical protein
MSHRRSLNALIAIVTLLCIGVGAALADSADSTRANERALKDSCRSYPVAPSSLAAEVCARALTSGASDIVGYGPTHIDR